MAPARGDRIRHVAGRLLSGLALLGDRLAGPGHFDGAAKATSRMRHDVSSPYPIELEMTDQADLRQGTSIDTRFL
jgi:hypothetical protein